jgi:uncharacterized membrane protein
MAWYWWVVLVIIALVVLFHYLDKWKRERLMEKYHDAELVDKLMQGLYWQGQTEEQLTDSLGTPSDVDQKVLKTKTKEIWKYDETGKNRYALKITLENGVVVGWDQK